MLVVWADCIISSQPPCTMSVNVLEVELKISRARLPGGARRDHVWSVHMVRIISSFYAVRPFYAVLLGLEGGN